MQASNCLRSTWWRDRRMRLPWLDESLVPEPLRAEHVRLKLRSSTVQSDDASPTCIFVGMFCIDAIDEKGGSHLNSFLDLISVIAFTTTPGAGTEVAADGSTIASRDASYRHQVNLDQGGHKWKSNQVWAKFSSR
ncbi:hypothetical protein C4D60_Mb04t38970 [Musa balbisiana]|uniref:Uncharacterized protein n=1 Tax=Musa balbisiana TaxID=52838 RepID=A0A4S8KHX8_MUSBA|nr:hypothetical protein C4D60_Mb04t38970 [Musa balbisiana]